MTNVLRWAFVGDLQIPYHDQRAVTLFMNVMKAWKPDAIDIVGDIDDQLEYSSFSDGTTDEFFNQLKARGKEHDKAMVDWEKLQIKDPEGIVEPPSPPDLSPLPFIYANAQGARDWYGEVRANHKDADIHASLGNHDIRIYKYMDKKAPEYNDRITPNHLWGLDDFGISWRQYSDKPLERFAGVHVHHGATVSSSGLSVRADLDSYDISLVRGHDHKGGVVYKTYPLSGRSLVGMNTGHLCDPNQYGLQYTINPAWELGFGVGWVVGNNVQLQFVPISPDYTCVLDGKLFQG